MMTNRCLTPGLSLLLWLLLIAGALLSALGLARLPAPALTLNRPATIAAASGGCLPSGDGYLRMRIRMRDVDKPDLTIDWNNADMQCEGGPRPSNQGMRTM